MLVALLGLAVAAGAGDVRRVARLAEPIERREHGRQVLAELGGTVRVGRAGRWPLPPVPLPSERAFEPPPPMAALALALALTLPWP